MKIAMKDEVARSSFQSISGSISDEEKRIRQDLAACYRLVALFGWDDLIATHLSAKIPGPDETFLINPIGFMFDEITASCLVKVNGAGEILQDTPHSINRAGFVIHSTVHEARPEAECVMHLHTRDGVAVSALEDGLLPLNQSAMVVAPHIAYHEYEGVAVNDVERARLADDLGGKRLMILRNHGTLSVAESVAEAFFQMYMLEWSCTTQVRTLGMSHPLHAATPDSIDATGVLMNAKEDAASFATDLVWPALLRKLDRANPGYME